jgi:hypothetical protein
MNNSLDSSGQYQLPFRDSLSACEAEKRLYPLVLRVVRRFWRRTHTMHTSDCALSGVARHITRVLIQRQCEIHFAATHKGDGSTRALHNVVTRVDSNGRRVTTAIQRVSRLDKESSAIPARRSRCDSARTVPPAKTPQIPNSQMRQT